MIKNELKRSLDGLTWLTPGWVQRVFVEWAADGSPDGWLLSSRIDYKYRTAVLTFYPASLTAKDRQRENILHDLLHAFSSIVTDYVGEAVERIMAGEDKRLLREEFFAELRARDESFVQDLAYVLNRKLEDMQPAAP